MTQLQVLYSCWLDQLLVGWIKILCIQFKQCLQCLPFKKCLQFKQFLQFFTILKVQNVSQLYTKTKLQCLVFETCA